MMELKVSFDFFSPIWNGLSLAFHHLSWLKSSVTIFGDFAWSILSPVSNSSDELYAFSREK